MGFSWSVVINDWRWGSSLTCICVTYSIKMVCKKTPSLMNLQLLFPVMLLDFTMAISFILQNMHLPVSTISELLSL